MFHFATALFCCFILTAGTSVQYNQTDRGTLPSDTFWTQAVRKDGFTRAEKIMVTIINPLYVLHNGCL